MTLSLVEACHTEVIEFHRVLEAWLRGGLPRVAAAAERMEQALADGCMLFAPSGTIDSRASLQERLFQAHGTAPAMRIRITDFEPVWTSSQVALVRYVEWRERAERGEEERSDVRVTPINARYSSVLFHADPDAPVGVRWAYIHETWIAGHAPAP